MDSFIHSFIQTTDGIPLPSAFTYPFHYTPHPLTLMAALQTQDYLRSRADWQKELKNGKMFGVLVVMSEQKLGYLAAFSGNLAGSNRHAYFVPPVYDLLQPDGFFRREEAEISEINLRIRRMETDESFLRLQAETAHIEEENNRLLTEARMQMKQARQERDAERQQGEITTERQAELIRQSQFQKAEYKRLERRLKENLEQQKEKLQQAVRQIEQWKQERRTRSAALQQRLFRQFRMLDANGNEKDLCQIFEDTQAGIPPAGTGECALPKLLQYAYTHQMKPLAMGEFWWGESPKEEIRHQGHFYPSCRNKCEPILKHMLQGLNVEANPLECDIHRNTPLRIVYEDEWLVVVNKPAGMLSVPGKDGLDSVYDRLRQMFPKIEGPLVVHRLDMATSGLLLAAKCSEMHRRMQALFANRSISKRYTALLEGIVETDEGTISLPLYPDPDNRPFQLVNFTYGKKAVTHFRVLERRTEANRTLVAFYPQTGRTHQLRVHASHPDGLNHPIVGDTLYGRPDIRLYLHAAELTFIHPATGETIHICSEADF